MSNKNTANFAESVEEACSLGILEKLAEEYILFCRSEQNELDSKEKEDEKDDTDRKKTKRKQNDSCNKAKFPNVAGFCRYFGIGKRRYEQLSKKHPEEFEKISAIFEDEALNSEISPSLLSAYLKRRLGYDEAYSDEKSTVEAGHITLVFDHDILKDGE